MVPAFNAITGEAEAGDSVSSRPAWSSEKVPGQSKLHKEILSQETKYLYNTNHHPQLQKLFFYAFSRK